MKLCEVRGCLGAAVGLVTIQARGWRVAESRRVCSRHHREFRDMEQQKDTAHAEARQALRAVLVEIDEWHTDAMVEHMEVPQLVAALRKHHLDTVGRLLIQVASLTKELKALDDAAKGDTRCPTDVLIIAATARLLEGAVLDLEPWMSEDAAVVGMTLKGAAEELRALSNRKGGTR